MIGQSGIKRYLGPYGHIRSWPPSEPDKEDDPHRVWTIVDCEGQLYVSPGYRFVNRIDYALCEVPWTGEDTRQPDCRYD